MFHSNFIPRILCPISPKGVSINIHSSHFFEQRRQLSHKIELVTSNLNNKKKAHDNMKCAAVFQKTKETYLTPSVYSTSSEEKTDGLGEWRSKRWHDIGPCKLRENWKKEAGSFFDSGTQKLPFSLSPPPSNMRRAEPSRPDAKGFLCRVLKLTVSGPPHIFETNQGEEIRYLYTEEEKASKS